MIRTRVIIFLQGCDPVKLTVKNITGSDWMVACMIPKGNMMVSMLKKVEDKFTLVQFNCSKKETKDNQELEAELKSFLEKGISNITKDGRIVECTQCSQHNNLLSTFREDSEDPSWWYRERVLP